MNPSSGQIPEHLRRVGVGKDPSSSCRLSAGLLWLVASIRDVVLGYTLQTASNVAGWVAFRGVFGFVFARDMSTPDAVVAHDLFVL